MERTKMNYPIGPYCAFLLTAICLFTGSAWGVPVSRAEALAVADTWYAMELNSGYLKITEAEKADRFSRMGSRWVQYLVSKDELLDEYPGNGDRPVLAYVVTYDPAGFVVVSGDDRIKPVMVFSADSKFRWDHPELNFLRHYLGEVMPAMWENMPVQTHRNWSILRAKLAGSLRNALFDTNGRAVYVVWNTAFWGQNEYYNDTCQAYNGNFNVPTGCTATAMAIKMRFHSWPPSGDSSHSYTDIWGLIRYDHSVDFEAQIYDWASMPDTVITSQNSGVARIMYHSGVAVDMDYEIGGSGAWPLASAMNNYFRYLGTSAKYSDHDTSLQSSIIGVLPVILSTTSHTILACGYRDTQSPFYYLNCGWEGSSNGWYDLDSLPGGDDSLIDRSYPYGQPGNWIYVQNGYVGTEAGWIRFPYNTLTEGEAASTNGGRILVKAGTYAGTGNVPVTFDNAVALQAYAGDVSMNGNVWLKDYAMIKLYGNGQLAITPAK